MTLAGWCTTCANIMPVIEIETERFICITCREDIPTGQMDPDRQYAPQRASLERTAEALERIATAMELIAGEIRQRPD